jgi:hypothetical protein
MEKIKFRGMKNLDLSNHLVEIQLKRFRNENAKMPVIVEEENEQERKRKE